jgi:hypothetical protein
MSEYRAALSTAAVLCGLCSCTLLPLVYPPSRGDLPGAGENRPTRKCPGCGLCYEWRGSAHWTPIYSATPRLEVVR